MTYAKAKKYNQKCKDEGKEENVITYSDLVGTLMNSVTVLLNIPINKIITAITGVSGISSLPIKGGIILVIISMLLTVIAGLIPAKKDPVEALRTE